MADFIQVCTSVDREAVANRIEKKLLAERLASCVQVFGPINSSYWRNGKIERAREWTCLIKARASDYRKIEVAIRRVHPYDVPEILAFPVLYGNSNYLKWIRKETARRHARAG